MKLIGSLNSFDPKNIKIEDFNRVALGLETRTRVYLAALPGPEDETDGYNELLLTTLEPNKWGWLWQLSLVLKDEPGSVAAVARYLNEQKINISILETLTIESSRFHALLAVIDLSENETASETCLQEVIQGNEPNPLLDDLKQACAAVIDDSQKPATLTRMSRLWNAHQDREQRGFNLHVEGTMEHGLISLDDDALFDNLFRKDVARQEQSSIPGRVLMFSDTEEKFLCMYFPKDEDCILRASILHHDRHGAIDSFTKALSSSNIINSYSRLQRFGTSAQWKVTLDVPSDQSCRALLGGVEDLKSYFIAFDDIELSRPIAPLDTSRRVIRHQYSHTETSLSEGMFKGRTNYVSAILDGSTNTLAEHFLISGFYNTGKTCLLRHLHRCLGAGASETLPVYFHVENPRRVAGDDQGVAQRREFWRLLISRIAREHCLRTGRASLADQVESFLLQGSWYADLESLGFQNNYKVYEESPQRAFLDLKEEVLGRWKNITVLVDNLDEGNVDLHHDWVALMERLDYVTWVMSSSSTWEGRHTDPGGLFRRMRHFRLGPLEGDEAFALLSEPFDREHGVRVLANAAKLILSITNRQPSYVQAVCKALEDLLKASARNVDVITPGMVREVVETVVNELSTPFATMFTELRRVLDPGVWSTLDAGESVPQRKLFRADLSAEQRAMVSLAEVPGLVIGSPPRTGTGTEDSQVSLVPLFRRWAKNRPFIPS